MKRGEKKSNLVTRNFYPSDSVLLKIPRPGMIIVPCLFIYINETLILIVTKMLFFLCWQPNPYHQVYIHLHQEVDLFFSFFFKKCSTFSSLMRIFFKVDRNFFIFIYFVRYSSVKPEAPSRYAPLYSALSP